MHDSNISYRPVLKAFLKGMCFVIPLLMISLVLKLTLPYACESVPCATQSMSETNRATFYFIGTSRTQRSISPSTLKSDLPDYDFVNLGLSSNSFLYGCQAASNLMKQNSGKKIICIELTGMALLPTDSYYYLLTPEDVAEVTEQHLSVRCTPEDVRGLLFFLFSIHGDIKKIVYPRLHLNGQPAIGFMDDARDGGSLEAMLTPARFANKPAIPPDVLDLYVNVIAQLQKEAEEKGNEIQFILPLMIREESEFGTDMAVFNNLPEKMKWKYSNEFLNTMYDSQYLSDPLHLNSKGAVVYSHELSEFIKQRFEDTL